MPFPYAYYKEEYNGPLHGTDLEAPLLKLKTAKSVLTIDLTSGVLDVTGKSVITVSTLTGNAVINSIAGGQEGQVVLIRKATIANSLTLTCNFGGIGEIVTAHGDSIVFGNGRYGGAALIFTGTNWHHIDNSGYFANGTALAPSLSFSSDSDSGFYNKANNVLGFSTDGVERFFIANTSIESLIAHRFIDGSAAAPAIAFSNDQDTGFYKAPAALVYTGDGADKVSFYKTGEINFANPLLRSDVSFKILTSSNASQSLESGAHLVSDALTTDISLLPVNGIYSKGNVRTGGIFQGMATSAQYADLAENYESDSLYPAGTVVRLGGSKEITLANKSEAFGVISTAPGFLLNSAAEGLQLPVALHGKVPCRFIGKIQKGDAVWSCGNGLASNSGNAKIGRALESKDTEEEGLVMIVTRAVI